MKKPLSASPARTNLTDREIAKIIGGLLGGLLDMTDIYSLRHAVQWLADTPEFWHELEKKPFDRERFRRGVAEALEEMTGREFLRMLAANCPIEFTDHIGEYFS